MRILCLNLQRTHEPSCAEIFLNLSPRVQFRAPHYIFVDIASTSKMFGGEQGLLDKALELARSFAKTEVLTAIANTAASAQALASSHPGYISDPKKENVALSGLGLSSLREFEGLHAWGKPTQIEYMISFFDSLGFQYLEDLMRFSLNSLRERWGDLGSMVWRKLHSKEKQVVSPLIPQEPLVAYGYFDDPIDQVHLLMQKMDISLNYLFLRLEGLGRSAQKLHVSLFCEYSRTHRFFEVVPVSPSREQPLFRDLILKKLETLSLENPIREYEIELVDAPEKIQQLDFFEPRNSSENRWKKLISIAQQSEVKMGFLEPLPSHFPERSFHFKNDWPTELLNGDKVDWSAEQAIQIKTNYAKDLTKSPRPSLLLETPLPLTKRALARLKFLSTLPIERIESSWWESLTDPLKQEHKERDYYFALSSQGQLLWVYQEQRTQEYFLHGYFD